LKAKAQAALENSLTVAICTYNNSAELALTLCSLSSVDGIRGEGIDVIIIDNNSTDDTKAIASSWFAETGIAGACVQESRQGLSFARNRALTESRASFVAFIDDDVVVGKEWLLAVRNAFMSYAAALVGGRSYIIYREELPLWLSEYSEIALSRCDYGDEVLVGTREVMFGLNYAVDRERALAVGGFRVDLGRIGKCLLSGEEEDLQLKLESSGGKVVYEPGAIVGHRVSNERLRRAWFLRRSYWGGVSRGIIMRESYRHQPICKMIAVAGREAFRALLAQCSLRMASSEKFDRWCEASRQCGLVRSRLSNSFR